MFVVPFFKKLNGVKFFVIIIIQRDCLFNKNLCKKERIQKILIYLLDRPVGRGGGVGEGALAAGVAQEGLVRRPHRHLGGVRRVGVAVPPFTAARLHHGPLQVRRLVLGQRRLSPGVMR